MQNCKNDEQLDRHAVSTGLALQMLYYFWSTILVRLSLGFLALTVTA